MTDVNANIGVKIDTSEALSQLKSLQRQISQFHTSIAKSSEAAAVAQKSLQSNLLNSINAIGAFSAEMRTVKTTAESFTTSLEKNKFSMREYFRYAGASTKTFGKLFKSEYDTIGKVAEERVKKLQTQYIKMGRDATGAMRAMAIIPNDLNMKDQATQLQIAAQKQQIFNQLVKQGSTNLLNFGKNTQWAGRQLMVGFTLPLMTLGSAASKTFMEMETAALKFRKVYGDLFTPQAETEQALQNVKDLGLMFTQYGVAMKDTVTLAADAAAAGFQGVDLQRQTTQATRLSILGQIDNQKALETTISLQNAFGTSSADLASNIDFLNAVENQTVTSLDDITTAIPKVAPVIQQLGGDVKDLAFFMTAMKEGGINASEGANALKSGLAAMINPGNKAKEMLSSMGIDIENIVTKNKGNLKATVIEFANALNQLDPLARSKAIEQLFGKFQFARISTLFNNVTKDANQAAKVLDLAAMSVEDLASLSEKELGMTADSAMNKFRGSVEKLKYAIQPIGEMFLDVATPILDFVTKFADDFNAMPNAVKKAITVVTIAIAAIGPVALMTFGLLANGLANIIKFGGILQRGYLRLTGQSKLLGVETQYLTDEQLQASAAAASLNQAHANLTQQFNVEATAVNKLKDAYLAALTAGQKFATLNPGMMLPGRGVKKYANGVVTVPGSGSGDTVPAMLTPGEAVIPKDMAKRYAPLINAMVAGNIPGYEKGLSSPGGREVNPKTFVAAHFSDRIQLSDTQIQGLLDSKGISQTIKSAIRSAQEMKVPIYGYTDSVIALSAKMNEALKNNSADVSTLTSELSQNLEATHIELIRRLRQQGVPEAEIQASAKRISQQVIQSLGGKKGKISESEFNAMVQSAYYSESAKSPEVNKAYEDMREISVLSDARRAGKRQRISLPSKLRTSIQGMVFRGGGYRGSRRRSEYADIIQASGGTYEKAYYLLGESAATETAKGAKTKSPSRISKDVGKNIGDGLVIGMQDKIDDVEKTGNLLGKAAATATQSGSIPRRRLGAMRPAGAPGTQGTFATGVVPANAQMLPVISSKAIENSNKVIKSFSEKMIGANNSIMNASFALSGLSGITSMFAEGPMAKFSEVVSQVSMGLFALMSVTQLLTQAKFMEVAATRAKTVAEGLGSTAGVTGLFTKGGGLLGFGKNLLTAGKFALRFAGGIGLAVTAISALFIGWKLLKKKQEEERVAVEGIADAATLTSDKLSTLADLFGKTKTKTAAESMGMGIVSSGTRSKVQEIRSSEEFKKTFATDIEVLRKAAPGEIKSIFESLSLQLFSQGYAQDEIQNFVRALQQESARTDVKLNFKTLGVFTKDGKFTGVESIKNQLQAVTKKYQEAVDKGMVKQNPAVYQRNIEINRRRAEQGLAPLNLATEKSILGKDAKKQLAITGRIYANTLNSITTALQQGLISAKDYNAVLAIMNQDFNSLSKGAAKELMSNIFPGWVEQLKATNPEMATLAGGIKNASDQFFVMQAVMLGTIDTANKLASVLHALKVIAGYEGGNKQGISFSEYASAKNDIAAVAQGISDAAKKQEDLNKVTGEYPKGTGDGEKSPFQKAIDQLKEQRTELSNTLTTFKKLKSVGMETGKAFEIAQDPILSAALATTKVGTKAWKEILASIKQLDALTKKKRILEIQVEISTPEGKVAAAMEYINAQIAQANLKYDILERPLQAQVDGFNNAIDNIQTKIDKKQYEIDTTIQSDINNYQQQVEDLQRTIELQFDRPIQALQDESSALSHDLEIMDRTAEQIGQKYDDQLNALEQIRKINETLINQQKRQISLADALSQGDVSAAAQLIQEMRAANAADAAQSQADALSNARQAEIDALRSSSGLSRLQIEERQWQISQQVYNIELSKKALDQQVLALQDKIYNLEAEKAKQTAIIAGWEAEIKQIQMDKIAPLQQQLDILEQQRKTEIDTLEAQRVKWEEMQNSLDLATAKAKLLGKEFEASESLVRKIKDLWDSITSKSITLTINTIHTTSAGFAQESGLPGTSGSNSQFGPDTPWAQAAAGYSRGGIVKYFANGGLSKGTDTVPAMLTPGEFVVNRKASEQFKPLLEQINNGSIGSFSDMVAPRYSVPKNGNSGNVVVATNNTPLSSYDNSNTVYNYSVNVSMEGNSDPNAVASAVITKIRQMDGQRIRRQGL